MVMFRRILLSLLLVFSLPLQAEIIRGKVVDVHDGDTITVLDAGNRQTKIRLAGIDAPELDQPYGNRSKKHLSNLVFGQIVDVDGGKLERYHRMIGKILVHGRDANLEQVRAGYAWHYTKYAKEQSSTDQVAYAQAESTARTLHYGLWAEAQPMPPWDYRHGGADTAAASESVAPGAAACLCGQSVCTGQRGGTYCMTSSGSKRYQSIPRFGG